MQKYRQKARSLLLQALNKRIVCTKRVTVRAFLMMNKQKAHLRIKRWV